MTTDPRAGSARRVLLLLRPSTLNWRWRRKSCPIMRCDRISKMIPAIKRNCFFFPSEHRIPFNLVYNLIYRLSGIRSRLAERDSIHLKLSDSGDRGEDRHFFHSQTPTDISTEFIENLKSLSTDYLSLSHARTRSRSLARARARWLVRLWFSVSCSSLSHI